MERNRSKKAKSLRAAGEINSIKKVIEDQQTHMSSIPRSPPDLSLIKTSRVIHRFVSNTVTIANQAFTLANGHDQFLTVTTVAGNAVPYVDSWRLKSIRLYATAKQIAGTIYNSSFSITPVAGDVSSNMFNEPEQLYQISNTGLDSKSLMIKCGKRSPLGGWHFTNNVNPAGVLFQYSAVGGSGDVTQLFVMDLEFETRMNLAGLPLGYGAVTGTTTLGTIGGRNISGFALRGINNLG